MKKFKILIIIGIIIIIFAITFIMLYFFNRKIIYNIYDGMKYVKQGIDTYFTTDN